MYETARPPLFWVQAVVGMGREDLWVPVIAGMGHWDVGDDEYWNMMLNGREGPSATPRVHAVSMGCRWRKLLGLWIERIDYRPLFGVMGAKCNGRA